MITLFYKIYILEYLYSKIRRVSMTLLDIPYLLRFTLSEQASLFPLEVNVIWGATNQVQLSDIT